MGHLFYEEVGNLGYYDTSGNVQSGYGLRNTGDFQNLVAAWYWSGTEYATLTNRAWGFSTCYGKQYFDSKIENGYGLAVRSGQVSSAAPVPEPSTLILLGAGLGGLAFYRRKAKK